MRKSIKALAFTFVLAVPVVGLAEVGGTDSGGSPIKHIEQAQPHVLAMGNSILGVGACYLTVPDTKNPRRGCVDNMTYEACYEHARQHGQVASFSQNGKCPKQ